MNPRGGRRAPVPWRPPGTTGWRNGTLRDQLILLYELQELDAKIRECDLKLDELPKQAQDVSHGNETQ